MNRALLLLPLLLAAAPLRAELLAGVAEAEVTPAVGVPLAGYGGRLNRGLPELNPFTPNALFRPSTGVRDPIEAQALALEQDGERIVLVALDAIGVERAIVTDLTRAVRRRGLDLPEERLLLCATHTHSGPGALSRRPLWALTAVDAFHRPTHRRLIEALADLVVKAWAARRPATLAWGEVEVAGVTRNRRAGKSRRVTERDVDPRLRLLRLDGADGRPLAAAVSYAIHPTCLSEENTRFSADVAGAIRRETSTRLGCPVLFLAGCEGDVAPSPGGEEGIAAIGQRLGAAAAGLSARLAPRPGGGIALATLEADLGPLRIHPELLRGAGQEGIAAGALRLLRPLDGRLREPLLDTRFRLTAVRLGSLAFLLLPGEPIVELGRALEAEARAAGFPSAWVVGLANGHMGYLTTADEYREGGYEAWLTLHGPGSAALLIRSFRELLAAIGPA